MGRIKEDPPASPLTLVCGKHKFSSTAVIRAEHVEDPEFYMQGVIFKKQIFLHFFLILLSAGR